MHVTPPWPEGALEDLRAGNLSFQAIADRYGRCRDTVLKLAKRHDIKKPPSARGPKALSDRKVLSSEHRMVGVHLNLNRGCDSYTQIGEVIGVSKDSVRLMESGTYDFKLSELLRIARLTGKDLNALISPLQAPSRD